MTNEKLIIELSLVPFTGKIVDVNEDALVHLSMVNKYRLLRFTKDEATNKLIEMCAKDGLLHSEHAHITLEYGCIGFSREYAKEYFKNNLSSLREAVNNIPLSQYATSSFELHRIKMLFEKTCGVYVVIDGNVMTYEDFLRLMNVDIPYYFNGMWKYIPYN